MIRVSIFPKCKALPTREEKGYEARFTSKPYLPEIVTIETTDDIIDVVTNHSWSPSTFSGFRRQDNFVSTDFMVLDIDDGMSIDEAEKMVHKLSICTICLPSTSHTPEHHKFRLIFPLARTITNVEVFQATMTKLAENFSADPACLNDVGRFYFGGILSDGFLFDEALLEPEIAPQKLRNSPRKDFDMTERVVVGEDLQERVERLYGEKREKVPVAIAHFLENAPDNLSGEWYKSSNSFLFSCGLLDLDEDVVMETFFSLYPHDELTEKVVYKMFKDGYNNRSEVIDEEL